MTPSRTASMLALGLGLAPRVSAQEMPDARAHHQLVYHAAQDRTYLIGGSTRRADDHHYFDDIWVWDGAQWLEVDPLPFPRSSHRVVYHAGRGSLILFGGGSDQTAKAEGVLWEWRNREWRAVGGSREAGRDEPGMCYDFRRERVVLFGGWDADGSFCGDTWEWDGKRFARVDSTGPSPRAGHGFLYDPARERCLLFGGRGFDGFLSDTWEWDGTEWRRLDAGGPPARWFFGFAADPSTRRIVLFGGRGPDAPVIGRDATGDFGDTWTWDGERWTRLTTDGPRPRSMARMATTPRGVVLFGGREERPEAFIDHGDTWELHRGNWVLQR